MFHALELVKIVTNQVSIFSLANCQWIARYVSLLVSRSIRWDWDVQTVQKLVLKLLFLISLFKTVHAKTRTYNPLDPKWPQMTFKLWCHCSNLTFPEIMDFSFGFKILIWKGGHCDMVVITRVKNSLLSSANKATSLCFKTFSKITHCISYSDHLKNLVNAHARSLLKDSRSMLECSVTFRILVRSKRCPMRDVLCRDCDQDFIFGYFDGY